MRLQFLLIVCLSLTPAAASAQRTPPLAPTVDQASETILTGIAERGTVSGDTAERLADAAALAMTTRDTDALVTAEATARVASVASRVPPADAKRLARLALEHQSLARRFVFQLDPERDDPAAALRILTDLIETAGIDTVNEFQALAVALAVVHDELKDRRVNENTVRPDEPGRVFAYYTSNARGLQLDPRRLPADLLVFLASATEAVDQLEWARQAYGRDRNHGARFFEIQYDIEHYRTGQPKAVTLAPRYCLEAIKLHGGVCADQAYFAEHVAKANGVPAAYMVGRSGEVSHAWLGYLRASRSGVAWDFNAGRYEAYRGVRGATIDPQTLTTITDGEMAMRASDVRLSDSDRWQAEALAAAADRVAKYDAASAEQVVAEVLEGRSPSRHGKAEHRVGLLRMSVERRPGDPDAWRAFARLAAQGDVDHRTIDTWLRAFERSSGRASPDMLTDIVELLLNAVADTRGKIDVLEWALPKLRGRSDLQAWVRLKQGEVFEAKGDLDNAWRAYDDVTRRFLNEGPFAVKAIDRMLAMLDATNKSGPDLELLNRTFGGAERPFAMGDFRVQSNWYQIGSRYAARLQAAGRTGEAGEVRGQIGS